MVLQQLQIIEEPGHLAGKSQQNPAVTMLRRRNSQRQKGRERQFACEQANHLNTAAPCLPYQPARWPRLHCMPPLRRHPALRQRLRKRVPPLESLATPAFLRFLNSFRVSKNKNGEKKLRCTAARHETQSSKSQVGCDSRAREQIRKLSTRGPNLAVLGKYQKDPTSHFPTKVHNHLRGKIAGAHRARRTNDLGTVAPPPQARGQ